LTKNLKDLVRAEKARREEASTSRNPFCFTVYDAPDSLTDVAAAVAAIEDERAARSRPPRAGEESGIRKGALRIAGSIKDAVVVALQTAHPKHFSKPGIGIISRIIVTSGLRHAAVPDVLEGSDTPSPGGTPAPDKRAEEDAVAERAARRIAAMRSQL
jgi:hypothetical protein